MRYFFILMLLNISVFIYAQDPHFSQYFASPLNVNPALTGNSNSDFRLFSNYRQQWLGNNTVYKTSTLDIDARLFQNLTGEKNTFGIGAAFMSDKSLNGFYKSSYASISTSYMIGLDESNYLGVGFGGTIFNKALDFSQVTFAEQFDGERFNESFPSNENGVYQIKGNFSFSSGLLYRFHSEFADLEVGVSCYNLNKPKQTFFTNTSEYIPSRYVFHMGYDSYLSDKLSLGINGIFQTQAAVSYFAGGGVLSYSLSESNNRIAAGLYYRHQDAIFPYVGFSTENLQIGLTYDVTISNLKSSAFSPKTFELSLIYCKPHVDEKTRKLIPWLKM